MCEIELATTPGDRRVLRARMEAARQLYSAVLGDLLRRLDRALPRMGHGPSVPARGCKDPGVQRAAPAARALRILRPPRARMLDPLALRLSAWAQQEGVHYQAAWKWFRDGQLPVPARQTASGTILVDDPCDRVEKPAGVALYARVSSADQRDDLDRQMGPMSVWATENGLAPTRGVGEVGSGLDGFRPKLRKLLCDPSIGTVVVELEYRERPARFAVEYVEAAMVATGRKLVVVEGREVDDDLLCDFTEVLRPMCVRLYGRRSAKRRAERAVKAAAEDEDVGAV